MCLYIHVYIYTCVLFTSAGSRAGRCNMKVDVYGEFQAGIARSP